MDCNTLTDFRQSLFACFGNGKDALMNLVDALLTAPDARSFAELSLAPLFVRRWPSLYEALDDARIDEAALQRLFITTALQIREAPCAQEQAQEPFTFAGDASSILRPQSPTLPDRSLVHAANLPAAAAPVAPGWQYGVLSALPQTPSSWTLTLSVRRIPSGQTPSQAIAAQLHDVAPDLPAGSRVLLDGAFGNAAFVQRVADLTLGKLMRTANNRVLYLPAPPPTGRRGRPAKDGARFAFADARAHPVPADAWSGKSVSGEALDVACWHDLHFKACRAFPVTAIRIHLSEQARVYWLLWQGAGMPPLSQVWDVYRRRFSIEHGFRFDKQALLWEAPRLRTPARFTLWSWVVAAVHNLLTVARPLVAAVRRPWERAVHLASPQQVRRALGPIIGQVGTPARPPRVRGKSPGRAKGFRCRPSPRFAVIRKTSGKKKCQPILV